MQSVSLSNFPISVACLRQLQSIADDILRAVEGAEHVIVILLHDGKPISLLCTDPKVAELSEIECTTGGPAIEALRSGRVSRIWNTARAKMCTEYATACDRLGIRSVAGFPITVDGERRAALAVTSSDYYGIGPDETKVVRHAVSDAGRILRMGA